MTRHTPRFTVTDLPRSREDVLEAKLRRLRLLRAVAYTLLFTGQIMVIVAVAMQHEAWPW